MATTTNYSWVTPDDTSLVKDGASAIRTLGSSVDTTTKNLNPSTTLGDIEYRSSTANTNTRLGIGTTGQVLTVAAGVPSWATASAGGMTLINTGGTALSGASVTISSIPSSYKNLQIVVRSPSYSGGDVSTNLRFNGDTGNNYNYAYGTLTENAAVNTNSMAQVSWVNDSASSSGLITVEIFDYANTTTKKVITSASIENYQGGGSNVNIARIQAIWNSNDAITSITVLPNSGSWSTGTVFVYGVS